MRIGIAIALCALVLPATALAKGPTAATITGPGLEKPLKLGGGPNALRNGAPMEVLMNEGGFFQVAWGTQPSRVLAKSPTTRLGPKYRVVYFVPGPAGQTDRIGQELYPYARGGLLTYTRSGQPFFVNRRTQGGWFRARPRLKTALIEAGLPASAPAAAAAKSDDGSPVALAALPVGLVLVGAAAFALRRRARPATA